MFHRTINPYGGEYAVVTTDGAGAVTLASATSGVLSAALTTDGSDGQLTITLGARASANYAVLANASTATAPIAVAQQGTPTTTTFVIELSDLATPTLVNPASVVVRVNLHIGPAV